MSATSDATCTLPAGQAEVLRELLQGPRTREQVDYIAGASNGPDVVSELRCRGLLIPCTLHKGVNRRGRPVRFGLYELTQADRPKARALLVGQRLSNNDSTPGEDR